MSSVHLMLCLVIGLVNLDFGTSCFWNMCLALANCWRFYQVEVLPGAGMPSQEQIHVFAGSEFVTRTMLLCVLNMVEKIVEERIISQIKTSESQQSEKAARKLLSIMCDADVLLDSSLKILGRHHKLSHLLMSSQQSSSSDADFMRLIEPDDQPAFLHMLEQCEALGESAPAAKLHIGMRDNLGRKVPVELCHVGLHVPHSDETKHLIGIKAAENEEVSELVSLPDTRVQHRQSRPFQIRTSEDLLRATHQRSILQNESPTDRSVASQSSRESRGSHRNRFEEVLRTRQAEWSKKEGRPLESRRNNSPAARRKASRTSLDSTSILHMQPLDA